jgi:hypothetical protein
MATVTQSPQRSKRRRRETFAAKLELFNRVLLDYILALNHMPPGAPTPDGGLPDNLRLHDGEFDRFVKIAALHMQLEVGSRSRTGKDFHFDPDFCRLLMEITSRWMMSRRGRPGVSERANNARAAAEREARDLWLKEVENYKDEGYTTPAAHEHAAKEIKRRWPQYYGAMSTATIRTRMQRRLGQISPPGHAYPAANSGGNIR